jgi:hypothetical protein
MKMTVAGVFAITDAPRCPCESAPISPMTSPAPRSATWLPSRTTSTAPFSMAKNSKANLPSRSSSSPAATSIGSAQSATRRSSRLPRPRTRGSTSAAQDSLPRP